MVFLEVNNVNYGIVGDVIWVILKVNGYILKMELDIGLAIFIFFLETYKEIFLNIFLVDIIVILKIYLGEKIILEGKLFVRVEYNN